MYLHHIQFPGIFNQNKEYLNQYLEGLAVFGYLIFNKRLHHIIIGFLKLFLYINNSSPFEFPL